jgi:hypothetical protein
MNTTAPMPTGASALPVPSPAVLLRLAIGGIAGLAIWEGWARLLTPAVLGYPLEPAGLIDALFQHNLGLGVPVLLREALHYAIGILGYPIAYFVISRLLPRWSLMLDIIVAVTFAIGVVLAVAAGQGALGLGLFVLAVAVTIASRFFNPNTLIRDSIAWGTFTWFNALGIMAPLGGLSFYLLGEGGALSFMSFVGHVIYGAVAAYVFERLQARALAAGNA